MKKLTEEIDMARVSTRQPVCPRRFARQRSDLHVVCVFRQMDIEECDEAVGAQLEENAELEATLEQEEKLLAETNANLKEMTDELEELLRGKGVELSSVMPELREMNEAKVTSDTRSAWRQREVEQQQARVRSPRVPRWLLVPWLIYLPLLLSGRYRVEYDRRRAG